MKGGGGRGGGRDGERKGHGVREGGGGGGGEKKREKRENVSFCKTVGLSLFALASLSVTDSHD